MTCFILNCSSFFSHLRVQKAPLLKHFTAFSSHETIDQEVKLYQKTRTVHGKR